jgi:hypothetical protein
LFITRCLDKTPVPQQRSRQHVATGSIFTIRPWKY